MCVFGYRTISEKDAKVSKGPWLKILFPWSLSSVGSMNNVNDKTQPKISILTTKWNDTMIEVLHLWTIWWEHLTFIISHDRSVIIKKTLIKHHHMTCLGRRFAKDVESFLSWLLSVHITFDIYIWAFLTLKVGDCVYWHNKHSKTACPYTFPLSGL